MDPIDQIRDAIRRKMKQGAVVEKAFVCPQDLASIWSIERVHSLFPAGTWTTEQASLISVDLAKILSVLILIGAKDVILQLRSGFFENNASAFYYAGKHLNDKCLPLDIPDITFLDAPRRDLFYEKQFIFIPVIIEESHNQNTQDVHIHYRLPFEYEEKGIGCGAYGTVSKVGIASRHLRREDGADWESMQIVACKTIETSSKDFLKEVKNLQILRESLTSHNHITLHLATIVHGFNYHILLPLAAHGDLELFMNEGYTYEGDYQSMSNTYDFDKKFPQSSSIEFVIALFLQTSLLADALRWLHHEFRVSKDLDLFCAHMDLNPRNILINEDRTSLVGKWTISDFGISVFRKATEKHEMDFVSIGDVHHVLSAATIRTRPQRGNGSYQAPEAHLASQNKVGRKSDVWSLGCIFAEAVVFALGRRHLLEDFRSIRQRNSSNDYFYFVTEQNSALKVSSSVPKYDLKLQIWEWLTSLPNQYPGASKWLNYCLRVIHLVLKTNPEDRPDAIGLCKLLSHQYECTKSVLTGDQNLPRSLYDERRTPFSLQERALLVTQTQSNNFNPQVPVVGGSITLPSPDPHLYQPSTSSTASGSHTHRSSDEICTPHSSVTPIRPFLLEVDSSSIEQRFGKGLAQLCPDGKYFAWLDRNQIHVVNDGGNKLPSAQLCHDGGWENLSMAGNYLAAWGHSVSLRRKLIHIRNIETNTEIEMHPSIGDVAALRSISIHRLGLVALLCGRSLVISRIIETASSSSKLRRIETLSLPERSFASASFSVSGRFFYAWSYGVGPDYLHVWRLQGNGLIRHYEECFQTEHHGHPEEVNILPYSQALGCVIQGPRKSFFVHLIPQSLAESSTIQRDKYGRAKDVAVITSLVICCIFLDSSLLAIVEHGFPIKKRYLRQYPFGDSGRILKSNYHEICQMSSRVNASSKMAIVENKGLYSLLVCNTDGTTERIKFKPQKPR